MVANIKINRLRTSPNGLPLLTGFPGVNVRSKQFLECNIWSPLLPLSSKACVAMTVHIKQWHNRSERVKAFSKGISGRLCAPFRWLREGPPLARTPMPVANGGATGASRKCERAWSGSRTKYLKHRIFSTPSACQSHHELSMVIVIARQFSSYEVPES